MNEIIDKERQNLGRGIKLRLAQEKINIDDARDGMMDCYYSSYLGGVSLGLQGFNIHGDIPSIHKFIKKTFKDKLQKNGASWQRPTVKALESIKEEMDQETLISDLPAELKTVHDNVCTLLISKASGDLGHYGDKSAIKEELNMQVQAPKVNEALREVAREQLKHMLSLLNNNYDIAQIKQETQKFLKLIDFENEF